jgi:hypothetical protein
MVQTSLGMRSTAERARAPPWRRALQPVQKDQPRLKWEDINMSIEKAAHRGILWVNSRADMEETPDNKGFFEV